MWTLLLRPGVVAVSGSRLGCLFAFVALSAACSSTAPVLIVGNSVSADEIATLVDSAEAGVLLRQILDERTRAATATGTLEMLSTGRGVTARLACDAMSPALPSQQALKDLARRSSMDFAALSFVRTLDDDSQNAEVRRVFHEAVAAGPAVSTEALTAPGAFPYTVLFAPGWLYRSHPDSGADFASQRDLLDRLGVENRLIPTAESGSIETNAATILDEILETDRQGHSSIIVSASKAGAEVLAALAALEAADHPTGVVAWLNIGGALAGSPLADRASRLPARWFVRTAFGLLRWDWAGLEAMQSPANRERLGSARIGDKVAVVNFVPVPLSGSVGKKVRGGYWFMRNAGPTDGVVPIADSVWPDGVSLVALGADHLLEMLRGDTYTLGLLRALDFAIDHHVRGRDCTVALTRD